MVPITFRDGEREALSAAPDADVIQELTQAGADTFKWSIGENKTGSRAAAIPKELVSRIKSAIDSLDTAGKATIGSMATAKHDVPPLTVG